MTSPHGDDDLGPSPELLAAYADGELDGGDESRALKARVEAWLAGHPEAAAEVASLQRLRELCQAAAPADLSDDAWDALRDRVRRAVAAGRRRPALRRLLIWGAGGMAAAVAAVWLTLALLPREASPVPTVNPVVKAVDETPWPVATADEVEILHVQGADTGTLAVGAPPVEGPLELAGRGDVTVKSVQPAPPDNMRPEVRLDGPTPMIWAPVAGERP
jgi:anti-sigma factor RsiW